MSFALAAIAVGTIVSGMGEMKAAKQRAAARRAKAEDNRLRAKELMERLEINEEEMKLDSMDVEAGQIIRGATSGLSGQSLMRILGDTQTKLNRKLESNRRAANFQAESLLRGGEVEQSLALQEESAGRTRAFGSFLRGAGQAGRAF